MRNRGQRDVTSSDCYGEQRSQNVSISCSLRSSLNRVASMLPPFSRDG